MTAYEAETARDTGQGMRVALEADGQDTPERRLWLAVLERALDDGLYGGRTNTPMEMRPKMRREARMWWAAGHWKPIVAALGWDVAAVGEALVRMGLIKTAPAPERVLRRMETPTPVTSSPTAEDGAQKRRRGELEAAVLEALAAGPRKVVDLQVAVSEHFRGEVGEKSVQQVLKRLRGRGRLVRPRLGTYALPGWHLAERKAEGWCFRHVELVHGRGGMTDFVGDPAATCGAVGCDGKAYFQERQEGVA